MRREPARGLLMDFDGTVADTLPALRRVYDSFLIAQATPRPWLPFEKLNGLTIERSMELLSRHHGWTPDIAALTRDYTAMCAQIVAAAPPVSDVTELLSTAHARGILVAIVSSGPSAPIRSWLNSNSLGNYVSVVIGRDDSVDSKPHPAPYATALSRMELRCHECIAVEDSLIGAKSALSAGLTTYLIGDQSLPPAIAIPSMQDLRLVLEHEWSP